MTTNRNPFLDIAKGFGIILVILGHCIQFGSGSEYCTNASFFNNPVFIIIYSFHMPLFFLISGYLFFGSSTKHSPLDIIASKFRGLILPILSWSIIYETCFQLINVFYNKNKISFINFFVTWLNDFLTSQWFLWAILLSSVLIVLGITIFKDNYLFYIAIITLSLFVYVSNNQFNINSYTSNIPLFITGYLFARKSKNRIDSINTGKSTIILISIIYIALVVIKQCSIYNETPIFIQRIHYCFTGILGTILFLYLLHGIYHISINNSIWHCLEYLGQKTLGIYIISGYLVSIFLPRFTKNVSSNIFINIAETIVVLLLSIEALRIIGKSKLLRLLLLGKLE